MTARHPELAACSAHLRASAADFPATPGTTSTSLPALSMAALTTALRSSSVSASYSPREPLGTRPVTPAAARRAKWAWQASRSSAPSLRNRVVVATYTPGKRGFSDWVMGSSLVLGSLGLGSLGLGSLGLGSLGLGSLGLGSRGVGWPGRHLGPGKCSRRSP